MTDKILIATPSYDGKRYCYQEYLDSLNATDYPLEKLSFLMIDNTIPGGQLYNEVPLRFKSEIIRLYGKTRQLNSREVIALCYSIIFCYAEGLNFDYLLLLESDVLMPSFGLSRLIQTSKDYPGLIAPISTRARNHLQIYRDDMDLWKLKGKDGMYRISRTPYKTDEIDLGDPIFHIGSATFSCILIPISYVRKLKITWNIRHYNHPDGFFYQTVKDLNIPVWCDSMVVCKHLQRPFAKNVIW